MQVCQLMSREMIVVSPDWTIRQGLDLAVSEAADELFVTTSDHFLIGVVPDFSLLKACLNGQNQEAAIETLLSRQVSSINHDATILEIAPRFRDGTLSRLAVLDAGRLIGVLCRSDILKFLLQKQQAPQKTLREKTRRLDPSHTQDSLKSLSKTEKFRTPSTDN